jgi:hypothetical protein
MWDDPIVTEVRKVREAHAARFNYDLQAIYAALKEAEQKSPRKKVDSPPVECCWEHQAFFLPQTAKRAESAEFFTCFLSVLSVLYDKQDGDIVQVT